MTQDELIEAVRLCWGADTTSDPDNCTAENSAWGQCAVTALVVQDHLGGTLLRGAVRGIEHYWNLLPGGVELDLTREQFRGYQPATVEGSPAEGSRKTLLGWPGTKERYELLSSRVDEALDTETSDLGEGP